MQFSCRFVHLQFVFIQSCLHRQPGPAAMICAGFSGCFIDEVSDYFILPDVSMMLVLLGLPVSAGIFSLRWCSGIVHLFIAG